MLRRNLMIVFGIILLVGSFGTTGYFYFQWKKVTTVQNPPEEASEILGVVSSYMELPQDENPTIATVVDKEKLADQPFFVHAIEGDKVLVYTNAKKAILYRPETKKVIEVAPIYFNENQEGMSSTDTAEPTVPARIVRIAYYNGSEKTGYAAEIETKIKTQFTNTETSVIKNAHTKYQGVIVVDLIGNMNVEADGIAKLLNGTVGTLPEGEEKPEADILIIGGE